MFHGCDFHIPVFTPPKGRSSHYGASSWGEISGIIPSWPCLLLQQEIAHLAELLPLSRGHCLPLLWAPHSSLLPTKKQQQQQIPQ